MTWLSWLCVWACNFTNTGTGPENFLSENPHFAKSALSRYSPGDFVALVEKHGMQKIMDAMARMAQSKKG